MSLENQAVLVTGSTSGIGRAAARKFGERGATVFVSGRDAQRGAEVVQELRSSGAEAHFIQADLSQPADVASLADQAAEVDILVNNAALFPFASTADMDPETVRSILDVNVVAPFTLVGRLAPKMAERGHGAIVNVSSLAAGHGNPDTPAYGASKAGLDLLTKAWALDYGPRGVRVNAVSPGPVRTPPAQALGDWFDQVAETTPFGRAASPEEIAAAIVFLASDDASYVNGAIVPVDAGMGAG